ncbi:family 43 glycosylhydrolase, partial [Acinetobacter baumannii]|nr:family 43 glycosylhydrolase [Acinetobacter baumannii]
VYDAGHEEPAATEAALQPRVARLRGDMLELSEEPRPVRILDADGKELLAGDNERRFFEAPWLHKHDGKYYFSYSTGDTHLLCYATGDSPYGPFTYQGTIMTPVIGWTTHHSICEFEGRSYLFYHDSSLSGGVTHLRSVKVT